MSKENKILKIALATVLTFVPSIGTCASDTPQIIKISAKKYEYVPKEIRLQKGKPVILQLVTEDRSHGFSVPELNIDVQILPGKTTQVNLTPNKVGQFNFFCDIFCGTGHDDMSGKIIVSQ